MEDIVINHWAVFTSAIANLALGAVWYSPALFFKAWKTENQLTDAQLKTASPLKMYGIGFLLALLMAYNMAFFLGDSGTDLAWGATAGFLTGFGWASAIFAIIALFELKNWKYILINSGFIILYFTIIGAIIGAWR